jgi:hypothetical protein
MRSNVEKRLQSLERVMVPRQSPRLWRHCINPDGSLHSLLARGPGGVNRSFKRLEGEADDAFIARARAEMDWGDPRTKALT